MSSVGASNLYIFLCLKTFWKPELDMGCFVFVHNIKSQCIDEVWGLIETKPGKVEWICELLRGPGNDQQIVLFFLFHSFFRWLTVWQRCQPYWKQRSGGKWARIWTPMVAFLCLTWKPGNFIMLNCRQHLAKGFSKCELCSHLACFFRCFLSTSGSNSSDSDGLPVHILHQQRIPEVSWQIQFIWTELYL